MTAFVSYQHAQRELRISKYCGNYMASIGKVGVLYAMDNEGSFPTCWRDLENDMSSPQILICPGSAHHDAEFSWSTFSETDSSYEIVSPGLSQDKVDTVFFRCKIHGHLGYPDATVFDGEKRRTKEW